MTEHVYLHMIKRAPIELHCDNMMHYYFSSGLHVLHKFSLPYWQEFEQQQHLRVKFKWKIKHIIWILFCHWLLLIFLADQDQLLALNVWSSSWYQIQIHGPKIERELHLNMNMDNDLCLNRSWPSPIPLKKTASLLHKLQDLVLSLAHRDQYTLPSWESSLSPPCSANIHSVFFFNFHFYIYTLFLV
jgi:hypothetical protein